MVIRRILGAAMRTVPLLAFLFIPLLIELNRQGRFPFEKLIAFYPFERINEAIADSESGRAIKPVVRFG